MGFKPRGLLPELRLTSSTVLRALTRSDARELYALIDANRARLRRWLPWLDMTHSATDLGGFLHEAHRFHLSGRAMRMAICERGEIVGVVSLEGIDPVHRHASIGYWIDSKVEGSGLMTRSVQALCDYGFRGRDLHRIEIRAAPENRRSRAVPERLGFREEGQLADVEWLYDRFVDHVVYAMVAPAWGGSPSELNTLSGRIA